MYCSECGEQVPNNSKFCNECGAQTGTVSYTGNQLNYGIAGRVIAGIGGILVVAGSLLPWSEASNVFRSYSYDGIDGDGEISLVLGILIIVGALIRFNRPGSRALVAVVFGILAFAFGIIEFVTVNDDINEVQATNPFVEASVGVGIYLIILGGVLGLGGILPNPKRK